MLLWSRTDGFTDIIVNGRRDVNRGDIASGPRAGSSERVANRTSLV